MSTTSGGWPTWRADSRAVYFVDDASKVVAVDLRIDGNTVRPSPPRELFQVLNLQPGGRSVQPDHQKARLLVLTTAEERSQQPVNVVLNWRAALLK